jgi:hypothetical protein
MSKLLERERKEKDRGPVEPSKRFTGPQNRRTSMDEHECGCSQPTSINELCPQCRADYEEYLRVMAMLRKSVAQSEPTEVEHADAA